MVGSAMLIASSVVYISLKALQPITKEETHPKVLYKMKMIVIHKMREVNYSMKRMKNHL